MAFDPPIHAVEKLWGRHHPTGGYPAGVIAVPQPISGLAFFPGGFGLWNTRAGHPLPPMPVGGVMVIGHDFHSELGYLKSFSAGGERLTLPTWSNLLRVLERAGLHPERCFFTNLYMGLRAGSAATGRFPGAGNPQFVAHCKEFLLEQLRVQRPSLVLLLGAHVPPVIGEMSPDLASWTTAKGFRHLDAVGPVKTKVSFEGLTGLRTTVVALLHPSLRHASLRHRSYKGTFGEAAEWAMLRDGIGASGLIYTTQCCDDR